MIGFRKMGRFFVREAVDHGELVEEPEATEGGMQHIQRCYLVRSVIEDLARVDEWIHDMVLEDRIGLEGPGLFAPVGHVIIYADGFEADVTELDSLQVLVAIAQVIGKAQMRPERQFELGDELRAAREVCLDDRM